MAPLALQQDEGRPRSRFYEVAHRIAARMEGPVARAFLAAVERMQSFVDIARLEAALRTGDVETIYRAGGADLLGQVLANDDALRDALLRTSAATGEASADVLQAAGVGASFDARHPDVVLYARSQAAKLVVQVSDDQREAIRLVVALAAEQGIGVRTQARAIREIVGVRPQHAQAPLRLAQEIRDGQAAAATARRLSAVDKAQIRSRIQRGTVTEGFVERMRETYTRRLLNRRALDIARTETLDAANQGQLMSWKQATEQGVLPATARRVFVVTPDDRLRDTHAAVPGMNEGGVGLDEPFDTPLGPRMAPPIEPNCRCGQGLIFPGRPGVL